MQKAKLCVYVAAGLLSLVAGSPISSSSASEDGAAGLEPVVSLEKPRYMLGEAIRFWVGVMPKKSNEIPEDIRNLRKPCSLIITRPDRTLKVDRVNWPLDLLDGGAYGWRGGWGLGTEKVEAGRYTLVLECAGEKTPPVDLIVEQNDILNRIKAQFRFERDGVVTKITPIPVVLSVQNGSSETIRFPQRGTMAEGIGLTVVRKEPAFSWGFPFPWEKLSHSRILPDTYTWDVASEIPSVILKPGEDFEQRFLLGDAYSFDRDGDYEITFVTVLSVLVGEKNGQFADFCPIRLPVTAIASFVLKSSE